MQEDTLNTGYKWSGSVASVDLFVLICAGGELFIAFNHSVLISSHSV